MMRNDDWKNLMKNRSVICAFLISCLMALLVLRLWQVQVLQGPDHRQKAQRQSYRPIRLNPIRGRIFTADGSLLVDNSTAYDLVFHIAEMRQAGRAAKTTEHILQTEKFLAFLLKRQSALTEEEFLKHARLHPVMPLHVFNRLSPLEIAVVSELMPPLPGVEILPHIERKYPYPGLASNLLGMTSWGTPDDNQFIDDFPKIYSTPQLIGRSGLESYYDNDLKGKPGSRIVMVDSLGYDRRTVTDFDSPQDGNDLHLTIDLQAQRAADLVMQGHHGALVVINVNTGAVIAAASSPTFSLTELTRTKYNMLIHDEENRPLFNRAFNGTYTPGSIVKPLMAMALLENHIISDEDTYDCTGSLRLGNTLIHCAKRSGHGPLNVIEALKYSCNPFFMHFGLELGIDNWQPFLQTAGFGENTGLDWPENRSARGIRPSREFATSTWKRNWIAIDTAYASIGQGAFTITPLQAAVYAAALANGGIVFQPFLVHEIRTQDGELLKRTAPVIRHRLPVSPENLGIIQEGMVQVAESLDELKSLNFTVAAKTGTAEVGSGENRHKNTWVIIFGPVEAPEYALACLVERGSSGGRTAVPLAAQFLQRWLEPPSSPSDN